MIYNDDHGGYVHRFSLDMNVASCWDIEWDIGGISTRDHKQNMAG